MRVNTENKKIKEIVDSRYIENIFPSKEKLTNLLKKGGQLKIYTGIDPTAPHLHLGHSTNFLLLRKFQKLGHQVIFLIGDFTAQIGDPTGKSKTRKALTKEEVLKNCRNYKEMAGRILNFKSRKNPVKLEFNSKWYEKFTLKETINLMAKGTVGQMIKRDMFKKRIKEKKEIYLHELIYPLLQGYDSVMMKINIEVGGNDQTFNMMIGRDLVKEFQNREKLVIATKLLINPKTKKKLMSKSEGNFIALDEAPKEMYGKIMALPDEIIVPCFELCTEVSDKELERIKINLKKKKINPRDIKAKLAREIVTLYYNKKEAQRAEKEFNRIFKEKKLPSKIPEFKTEKEEMPILDLIFNSGLAQSKSQAKRLVLEKAVKINGEAVSDWKKKIKLKNEIIISVGKRKFIKINKL